MKSTTGIALFTNAKGTFSGPLTQFDCKGSSFFSDTQTFCNFMQKKIAIEYSYCPPLIAIEDHCSPLITIN